MAKLNDFIRALENYVEKDHAAPSSETLELALSTAAVPIQKNGSKLYRFADGETLSIESCLRYAQMLAA